MSTHDHKPNWALADFETIVVVVDTTVKFTFSQLPASLQNCGELSLGVRLIAIEYVRQPEYAEIRVEWDEADAILQTVTPYKVSDSIGSIRGSKGIELVGRGKSVKVDLP